MSVFEVKPEYFDHLTPEQSVDLIRKLIWAEASISGIKYDKIDIPSAITVRDGGIDGIVTDAQIDGKYGIIKKGLTYYQIKSGAFSLTKHSIECILLKENSKELKDRIKSCLEKQGTLIIAFTKYDNPDKIDNLAQEKFKKILTYISPKYKDARIEIWRQNTIRGFLTHFPALRLDVLGISSKLFLHEYWSKFGNMKLAVKLGENQNEFIDNCRKMLRDDKTSTHIRVLGEPGIGKTRLVLEATSKNDLSPLVLYAEDPSCLDERNFLPNILLEPNPQLILIVDECDCETSTNIWNKLKNNCPSIKLITIFNEPDDSSGITRRLDVPELNDNEIGKIIKEYVKDDSQISKWIDFCSHSPRAAHIIGRNLKGNPEDILKSPDDVPVWKRYIGSSMLFDTVEFKNRENVLLWLSLFKKFGHEHPFDSEGKKIASLVQQHHNIPSAEFTKIIDKLRDMKILQGRSTLYITPKILHVYLWTEWWKQFGGGHLGYDVNESILDDQTPNDLINWYCEMFEYASQSPKAGNIISELLKQGGFFDDNNKSNKQIKANFFLILGKSDPNTALDYLYRIIGGKSRKELLNFSFGRREAVLSLESFAQYKQYFEKASNLLLMLAEAENEDFSNNATGVFVNLFSPGSGKVATTEIAPKYRIPILELAINSESKLKNNIAIKACDIALNMHVFSKLTINPGEFGQSPDLWESKSNNEVMEYYGMILDILDTQLDKYSNQDTIVNVFLNHLRSLLLVPTLTEQIMKITQKIHKLKTYDEKILGIIIRLIELKRDNLLPNVLKHLEDLQNDINGTDFHSRMKRYIGMDIHLDWNKNGNRDEKRKRETERLITESLIAKNLEPELAWLVTNDAKNGYQFGYELANKNSTYSLLPLILAALSKAKNKGSGFFVGGYFLHIRENNIEKWEEELEKIYNDPILYSLLPEITMRSGMSDKSSARIIRGIDENKLDYTVLGTFKYGSKFLEMLSEKSFEKWIMLLIEKKHNDAILIALNLFYTYFVSKNQKSLPRELTLKLLLHDEIMQKPYKGFQDTMDSFNWKEIGLKFVQQYPKDSMSIAETIFKHTSTEGLGHYDSDEREVLDIITMINPGKMWKIASQYIGPPLDARAFDILDWLRGGLTRSDEGILNKIPIDKIVAWVDEDKKTRASYIVDFLPLQFDMTREFLIRYGDQDKVRKHLMINYENESWMGSDIVHYEEKKKKFEDLKKNETHITVLSWLDQYIQLIENDIERSRERDERGLY